MSNQLKKPPLVEAILEIRWGQQNTANPPVEDANYPLMLGRLQERVQEEYPVHEPLHTAQLPALMVRNMAQHRFRTVADGWPLIQVGPGLMTVNETEGYKWSDFQGRCVDAVTHLAAAHPSQAEELGPLSATLRYINAIKFDHSDSSVLAFLKEKLKITASLPDVLFEGGVVKQIPNSFNWQSSFVATDPAGTITIRVATGSHKGDAAVIWEILMQSDERSVSASSFSKWLDPAHDLAEKWFFQLIDGELKKEFSGD